MYKQQQEQQEAGTMGFSLLGQDAQPLSIRF